MLRFYPYRCKLGILLALVLACSILQVSGLCAQRKKKEIPLDTQLVNNSIRWKARIPIAGKNMSRVSYGPFQILKNKKDKAQFKKEGKENEFIFWKLHTVELLHSASLVVLYNRVDSVRIELFYTSKDTYRDQSVFGWLFNVKVNNPHPGHDVTPSEMIIRLPRDTVVWMFIPAVMDVELEGNSRDYYGRLVSGSENIDVRYARGLIGHTKTWVAYPTGLIFAKDGVDIAAVQNYHLLIKPYVWLAKDLDEQVKVLVGSYIVAYLSIKNK